MRTRTTASLTLLVGLMGIVSACGATESAPARTVAGPGELTAVHIEVHEAPG